MDNNIIQQIKEIVTGAGSIGITVGKNPTVDDMAAALGLYIALQNANKKVLVASPTDPIVEFSSLVGVNKITKTLSGTGGGSGDLTVSFPYVEGEIEKVSYTTEEGYLNIIVKASQQGLSFSEQDVRFQRGGGEKLDAVFVIGAAYLSEVESVFDTQDLDIKIINVDKRATNEGYGDIVDVILQLSSVSEEVARLVLSMGIQMDQDAAQNFMTGISDATKNFQSPQTSSLAFEVAGNLMKKGAVRARETIEGTDLQRARQDLSDLTKKQVGVMQDSPVQEPSVTTQPQVRPQPLQSSQPQARLQQQAAPTGQDLPRTAPVRQPQTRQPQPARTQPTKDQGFANDDQDAPDDWLTPKVYKGSTDVN